MQSASSRIWTHVAVSISYNDNHYTTDTSFKPAVLGLKIDFVLHLHIKRELH